MNRQLIFLSVLSSYACAFASAEPLQVFVLAGQSNMQGHAHVRTFEHLGMDPETLPLLREMQTEDGTPRSIDGIRISSLSTGGEKRGPLTAGFGADEQKIGPEFTFGIYTQKRLGQPILLIKTAWGGKSLHTDFRPPGAGPYRFSKTQRDQIAKQGKDMSQVATEKADATGRYYRLMIGHIKRILRDIADVHPDYDPEQGYQLAGFVWFQGWNDMVDRGTYPNRDQPGGYRQYTELLSQLIRDVRNDLSSPHLPFVIGVMGVGGPVEKYLPAQKRYAGIHQNFRDAMAAPAKQPELKNNVIPVYTERYWETELVTLKARNDQLKTKLKSTLGSGVAVHSDEAQAALNRLRSEAFTPTELKTLEKGISNAEYHYLGSAKIMARIGKGFADALANAK